MCYEKFLNTDRKPGWVPETLKNAHQLLRSSLWSLPTANYSVTVQLVDAKCVCRSSAAPSVVSAEQKVFTHGLTIKVGQLRGLKDGEDGVPPQRRPAGRAPASTSATHGSASHRA